MEFLLGRNGSVQSWHARPVFYRGVLQERLEDAFAIARPANEPKDQSPNFNAR